LGVGEFNYSEGDKTRKEPDKISPHAQSTSSSKLPGTTSAKKSMAEEIVALSKSANIKNILKESKNKLLEKAEELSNKAGQKKFSQEDVYHKAPSRSFTLVSKRDFDFDEYISDSENYADEESKPEIADSIKEASPNEEVMFSKL